MSNFLPKSLFSILLAFITALFFIYALVTGSMTWADSKQQQEVAVERNIERATKQYQINSHGAKERPPGLRPAPPHLQKYIHDLGEKTGKDLRLYHNPRVPGEFWIEVNGEAWVTMPTEHPPFLWARTFAPKLGLMAVLIAISAWFLSYYIKTPLARLTLALNQFKTNRQAPKINASGPQELKNVTHQVNDMMQEISSFEQQRELVLAGIAHDIRTPLARIRVAIEMIPQLPVDKLNALINDIEQINHLQTQFLDYTRCDRLKNDQEVDINGLLTDCANQYNGQNVNLDLSTEEIIISADATQFYRAIDNVINNAFKYGEAPVNINTSITKQAVTISITDHGDGVAEDELKNLIQPLYRGEASRADCEGTGLGLSIVHRCITHMNGELKISNTEDAGLTVTIILPVV